MQKRSKVWITGISGFVGSWIWKYALEDGIYDVRGTVRDSQNRSKIEPLQTAFGDELWSQLEIVEADLLDSESLK